MFRFDSLFQLLAITPPSFSILRIVQWGFPLELKGVTLQCFVFDPLLHLFQHPPLFFNTGSSTVAGFPLAFEGIFHNCFVFASLLQLLQRGHVETQHRGSLTRRQKACHPPHCLNPTPQRPRAVVYVYL